MAALAATLAAAGAAWTAVADARDRDALAARAVRSGLHGAALQEVQATIRRERDPAERRLALARALFASRPAGGSAADLALRIRQLQTAEALAAEALADLPASWEASSLLGAARFESRRLRRDTRLYSAATDWERPLFAAVARASGSSIVERQLATAYLEVWPAMAPERRDQAAELLRRMFRDRRFLVLHLRRWVDINKSIQRAAELLPADAETARRLLELATYFGNARDAVFWARESRNRLLRELEAGIEHARASDEAWTSAYLASAVEQASLGLDFAPLVEKALLGTSAESGGFGFAEAAAGWLRWAEPLCLIQECPLDPPALTELLRSAAALIGSPSSAFARVAAGKPLSAEQLVRRANGARSEDWASYNLLRAKQQLAAGDRGAARVSLAAVHRKARLRPMFARLTQLAEVAASTGDPENGEPLKRTSWGSADWQREPRLLELEMGLARAGQGVRLEFGGPVWQPFLLEVELDGRVGPILWVTRGVETIDVPLAIEAGVHLLRLRALNRDLHWIVRIDLT